MSSAPRTTGRRTTGRRGGASTVVAAVAVGLLGSGCTPAPPGEPGPLLDGAAGRVAATVDGRDITAELFDRRMGTVTSDADVATAVETQPGVEVQLRADVLAQMVEADLVAAAAPAAGVEVSAADVDAHVRAVAAEQLGPGDDAWARFLEARGYPEEEVRAQLGEDLLRERVEDALAPDAAAEVTAEEVARAFADGWAGRRRVSHVLLTTEADAAAVLAEVRAGADFGALARERSADAASAAVGGDLGPWSEGDYVAAFDQAVETADVPELLGPVASPFGWHVIDVRAPATLEEVAPQITARLAEQRQDDALAAWVADLRAGAEVEVRDDLGTWDAATGQVVAP